MKCPSCNAADEKINDLDCYDCNGGCENDEGEPCERCDGGGFEDGYCKCSECGEQLMAEDFEIEDEEQDKWKHYFL